MILAETQGYAFLGGTFDPIHKGHLAMAEHARHTLGFEQVALMPSGQPVHRKVAGRTAQQRLAMVELALADQSKLLVDASEVLSSEPSYTLTSLKRLRQQVGAQVPLVMVMGMDSLMTLHTWRGWQEFLGYCHLFVCARPHYSGSLPEASAEWFNHHVCDNVEALQSLPCGKVYVSADTAQDISATSIRQALAAASQGDEAANEQLKKWLPSPVINYIYTHQLYGVSPA
ncbi:MAG: nicotinate-nucleotide adenylyltransferase [Pontibacterium sp.]